MLQDTREDYDMLDLYQGQGWSINSIHDHFGYFFKVHLKEILSEDCAFIVLPLELVFKQSVDSINRDFAIDYLSLAFAEGQILKKSFLKIKHRYELQT